jgi:hypothetical protein
VTGELRKQLEALHGELGRTNSVDPQSRELLIALMTDIARLLDSQSSGDTDHASPRERLHALAVQFEAEHPALGTAIRRVVDTLAKAGI